MELPNRWLLLRGLVREKRHWDGFDDALRARVAPRGGEVVCVDLPGVGTERHRPCPASVPAMVDDVRARFLAERGDRGPFGLFAASLGGMLALDWAGRYPDDFAAVVVSNTSARDVSPITQRLSLAAIASVARAFGTFDSVARERVILGLVANTEHARSRAAAFAKLSEEAPVPRATLFRQLYAASRATTPATMRPKLMVLASDGDRMVSAACSRAIASRFGAELRVHPTAGHDLPLDEPQWVIDQLAPA